MRTHLSALAACRRCSSLRPCCGSFRNPIARRFLSSVNEYTPNALKEDSHLVESTPTVRISRIQAVNRRKPTAKSIGLTAPNHTGGSRRVTTFTPKGFQREVFSSLIVYLKSRTSRNEDDLLNTWKDFIWQWGSSIQRPRLSEISGLDWSFLPQVNGASFYNSASDGRITSYGPWRIRVAMPLLTWSSPDIFTALLGTFCALLLDGPSKNLLDKHGPFLQFAASIMYRSSISSSQYHLSKDIQSHGIPKEAWAKFSRGLEDAHSHATIVLACNKITADDLSEKDLDAARIEALEERYIATLERLTVGLRSLKLEAIWKDLHQVFSVFNSHWLSNPMIESKKDQIILTPNIYLSFMRVGYLLDRYTFAVEVWNEMVQMGVIPEIRHLTTAIRGAGGLKDHHQIERLWQMLMQSGIKTDDPVWTARIAATIQAGDLNKGLAMLLQMGDTWLKAKRSQLRKKNPTTVVNMPPKPSVMTLNVALSALSRAKNPDLQLIRSLISWAASLDIRPDTATYNIIVSMFARAGKVSSAIDILNQMRSQNIPPDVITYTSLLSVLFKPENSVPITREERTDAVVRIITLMESDSIVPNDHTLAMLLTGALQGFAEPKLTGAILAYARFAGRKIYGRLATTLLKYYFESPSPNIESVLDLWNHINNADLQADSHFFDQMVQGLASAGRLDLMSSFLNRMVKNGMSPTWSTLLSALSVSTEQQYREIAEMIVSQAKKAVQDGVLSSRQANLPDAALKERLFWDLARSYDFDV
jgi:pentatricopeptide repeat protein